MTRLEKVCVIRDATGIKRVMAIFEWLLDAEIDRMRRFDTAKKRRELQCKSTGEK